MRELTDKQQQILHFITEAAAETGRIPTIREIAGHFRITIGPVQRHLEALRRKGCLSHTPGIARGLEVSSRKPAVFVPILGRVPAGNPMSPSADVEGHVCTAKASLRNRDHFALRVRGESMTGAGILPGDVVIVCPQQTAEDNDIVIAMIDNEATVKKLRKKGREVWLAAANPAYPDIRAQEIVIVGKVIELVREYHGNNDRK